MSIDSVELTVIELEALVVHALSELGLSESDISIVKDVLLYAERRGKSQGLVKITERSILPSINRREMHIKNRSACISHIDANGNIGMVVLDKATEVAIENCRSYGLAIVGTCGTASSTGSIGYYVQKIATAGYIGIVMAGSPKVMALHGSAKPVMGTNPIAFGVPTSAQPLVFDMATSAITWFDIISKRNSDEPIPSGVALDNSGEDTTSAKAALEGALKTFGGAKGSGLALMVECLTGPLMGASIVGDELDSRGNFVLALNPTALAGDDFYLRMDELIAQCRASATGDELRLPGDSGHHLPDTVVIPRKLYNALKETQ